MSKGESQLDEVDIFKGLAIIGVVMLHYNSAWECPINLFGKLSAIGARCPQVFFVLSGFLSWRSLEHSNIRPAKYYYRRYIRLFPDYYFALILCLVIPLFHKEAHLLDTISHLLFFNAILPQWANSIIGIEWYVSDLAILILAIPLIRKQIRTLKESVFLVVICEIISIIFTTTTNILFADAISNDVLVETWIHTFCFINQMPVLAIGVLLYHLVYMIEKNEKYHKTVLVYCFFSCLVSMLCIVYHLNKRIVTSSFIAGLMFSILFVIVKIVQHCDNNILKTTFMGG